MGWGTLVLATGSIGATTCLHEFGGDAYNPTGGGAGEGKIDAWVAYDCTNELCETTVKSKQEFIPEGLERFGEWEMKLTEVVAGKPRPKIGNSINESPTQMKFGFRCPPTGLGEIRARVKGELSPLAESGTAIGSGPSKLKFNAESGELEVANVKEGHVEGSLKTMGYEGGEIISTKNP